MKEKTFEEKIKEAMDESGDLSMHKILEICAEMPNMRSADLSEAYRRYHVMEEFIDPLIDEVNDNYDGIEVAFTKYVIEMLEISQDIHVTYIVKPSPHLQQLGQSQKSPKTFNEESYIAMRELYEKLIKATDCFNIIGDGKLKHFAEFLVDQAFINKHYVRFVTPHYELLEKFHGSLRTLSADEKMKCCEKMLQFANEEIKKKVIEKMRQQGV